MEADILSIIEMERGPISFQTIVSELDLFSRTNPGAWKHRVNRDSPTDLGRVRRSLEKLLEDKKIYKCVAPEDSFRCVVESKNVTSQGFLF